MKIGYNNNNALFNKKTDVRFTGRRILTKLDEFGYESQVRKIGNKFYEATLVDTGLPKDWDHTVVVDDGNNYREYKRGQGKNPEKAKKDLLKKIPDTGEIVTYTYPYRGAGHQASRKVSFRDGYITKQQYGEGYDPDMLEAINELD